MWIRSLDWEVPLEEGMATHSSILAWRIPWTDEPGRLQSIELQRAGHDFGGFPDGLDGKESACNVGDPGSVPGLGRYPAGGYGNPLQYSCLENSMDREAWWATVQKVTKSWTQLSSQGHNGSKFSQFKEKTISNLTLYKQ